MEINTDKAKRIRTPSRSRLDCVVNTKLNQIMRFINRQQGKTARQGYRRSNQRWPITAPPLKIRYGKSSAIPE
jgi:hypothetical protein